MKVNLKYEVYGILLIIFSVIALAGSTGTGTVAGMGSVGRSLNYIFYFLVGRFHFVLPLIGIYIGLYVMMKRKWPKSWSYIKTGLLLLLLGFLIHSHTDLYRKLQLLEGQGFYSMISHPFANLEQLLKGEIDVPAFYSHLGGGLTGAVLYGVLYFLFDDVGARLMTYSLWIIGFICITGWTISDIVLKIRTGLKDGGSALSVKLQEMNTLLKRKRNSKRIVQEIPKNAVALDEDEGPYDQQLEEEEELVEAPPTQRRKWFTFFADKPQEEPIQANQDDAIPMAGEEDELDTEGVLIGGAAQDAEERPFIRDFQDHEDGLPLEGEVEQIELPIEPAAQSEHESEGQVIESAEDSEEAAPLFPAETPPEIPYQLPRLQLLNRPAYGGRGAEANDHKANARKLEATLESFGVRAKVLEVVRGPAVTRYEIQPDIGVKVSRIVSLTDDIALALAAKDIRMEAPIPGKSAIGIEVPNTEVSVVTMREVMESPVFTESEAKLSIALGRDISGQPIVGNLAKMPHLLVAGATGSGKSVCINGIIVSILYKAKPDEVKFLMIDPKMVELNMYNGIPHLLAPVVTDPRRASLALKQVVREMEKRYELFSKSGTRNIEAYNSIVRETGEEAPLPYIVVIVDELADLMMVAASDVEDSICRLAQMARAAGIHLIIATQRPSVDVITGLIKANIPSRIAFGVSSQVDSRTILDSVGAEKLLGRGDMLFVPVGASKPIRIQGAFLSDKEAEAVVNFVREQEQAEYREDLVPEVEEQTELEEDHEDELYEQAVQLVLEAKQASVSLLQRRMRIGYTRAARLIDYMEAKGIVGPYEGSKPREVLLTYEQYVQQRASS